MTTHAAVTLPTDQLDVGTWGPKVNADLTDLARAANGAIDDAAAAQATATAANTLAGTANANATAASSLATAANNALAGKLTTSAGIITVVKKTQAEWNAITAPVATTIYLIVG